MKHLIPRLVAIVAVAGLCLHAQMPSGVQKDDWEEINFEFNSSVLTDGFPSLLRLSELLNKNSGFRVKVDGHTDSVGSEKYNEKLSQKRAEAVKTFLEKYGARATQIEIVPRGKRDPKVDNKTSTNRWINRRVQLTVLDQNGKIIGAGGVGEAIKAIQTVCPDYSQTLAEILKKLDKLDDINRALAAIAGENARLRSDIDALKGQQQQTRAAVDAAPRGATTDEVKKTINDALEANRDPRFAILGLNAGADNNGAMTFSGRGRYFAPFREKFAIQAQGEYLYFKERKEGQFDVGLVSRYAKRGQAGVFSSFKHVSLFGLDNGATMGQFAGTLDYIFSRGRVGFFGTKGFLNNQVMNTRFISRNIYEQTYARIVDQAGASTAISLWGNSMVEGNFGALFVKGGSNKPGGTVRFTQPISRNVALTLEGGWNETYVSAGTNGRFVAGLLFGNFAAPKEYLASDKPVPVDIPRVRYELLTKRVRTGNDAPVADAGPDQIGVAAGTIGLDGSASFDPDGDPITFQWDQVSGPPVDLSGRNTAKASFRAVEGQNYSFRLTVKDDHGSMSLARVSVSTQDTPKVIVQRFNANPSTIKAGASSVLSWQVLNADEVEISGIGKVNNQGGTTQVSPAQTTTYRLTARNKAGEATDTVTVTVEQPTTPTVRIIAFRAAPTDIRFGEASNLVWETENAETVTIDGIGTVQATGTTTVSPKETTTYRLTATNKAGSVSSTATITVLRPAAPRILSFTGDPSEIGEGESATLAWRVEGATEVEIAGLGQQTLVGNTKVSPVTTTTYILTARNTGGEATASVTIKVFPQVTIGSFTANPTTLAKPGDTSKLTWDTTNATSVTISGVGAVPGSGSVDVKPDKTTTYTLTASNSKFTVTRTVTVTVQGGGNGGNGGNGGENRPPVVVGNVPEFQETIIRDHLWDFSASTDPDGDKLLFNLRNTGTTNIGNAIIIDRGNGVFYVQLMGGLGEYTFQLTVSDGKGGTVTKTYRVLFQGQVKP